jgi:hypothetical protein
MMRNIIFATLVVVGCAATASAQSTPPAQPALVVEQIQSGWLFAPDVRATDLGGQTGALAGGYIGHITDRSWVIGAGGYFLTNREDDFKLAYGGPVAEWLFHADRRIGFGVRALVGAGTATLPRTLGDLIDPRVLASSGTRRRNATTTLRQFDPNATVAINEDFFVAEPQVNVMLNLSPGQRLVFGVGYRAVGNAPLLGDQLNGVSGSVSFQIGGK